MLPYQNTLDAIIVEYATNPDAGLSDIEAQKRLAEHGANVLPVDKRRSWLQIFISQFQSPLIYILLIAAIIIFFVGDEPRDAFIIAGVLLFNAIIGAMQEGRTADIVQSLKQFIETTSVVIRNHRRKIVDDRMLVVGDLVILQEGEKVPADIRIIESHNLTIDQSVLTGESNPVSKNTDSIDTDVPLMERANMVYKGTYILSGFGKGIVTATGLHTEIGLIHHVIEEINTEVPLRKDVEHLTYVILLCVLGLCTGLFALGYCMGKPLNELMVMLTALFICIVPEGLPVVLTLVLVSGVYRMAKQFVLVKNMQAVETLGRTDVIVIDKTGTLTRNEMMVSHIYTNDKVLYHVSGQGYHVDGDITRDNHAIKPDEATNDLILLGQAGYLLNTAEINYHGELDLFSIKGDPTEAALYVFAQKLGIDDTKIGQYTKVYEILFDSRNAYHASFYVKGAEAYIYMLGAPEVIFVKTYDSSTEIKDTLHRFLEKGLRMVACAVRILKESELPRPDSPVTAWHALLTQMHCVGIIGIQDAIRPDVKYVIAQARNAGLNLIMATGDHQKTALYVAQEVGIYTHGDKMLDGARMDQLTDEQLINESIDVTIYSRVSSFHKMRIIKALHARHMIVAMTGDGINDAPSLVAADLGIAMGRIGTEVAKKASDIILLNDSCISIIRAIEQGRHIFYTLKRVILYFFATNTGEIFIIFFALIVEIITGRSLPLPLTAAQILWLNLVTDGFLNIALSMEPQEQGLLSHNWLVHKPRLVDAPLIGKMLLFAFPMGAISLYMFLRYYQIDVRYARTMTFVTMTMFQWFNAWNCRSDTKSLVQLGLGTNRWLLAATVLILILQMCILNIPWLQGIFNTVPLSGHDWLLIIAVSLPIIFLEEIRKWIVRILYAL
jgi:magnesium-transporting ATPase (P-type)